MKELIGVSQATDEKPETETPSEKKLLKLIKELRQTACRGRITPENRVKLDSWKPGWWMHRQKMDLVTMKLVLLYLRDNNASLILDEASRIKLMVQADFKASQAARFIGELDHQGISTLQTDGDINQFLADYTGKTLEQVEKELGTLLVPDEDAIGLADDEEPAADGDENAPAPDLNYRTSEEIEGTPTLEQIIHVGDTMIATQLDRGISTDDQAIRALLRKLVDQLWHLADSEGSLDALNEQITKMHMDGAGGKLIADQFHAEVESALNMPIPAGWNLRPDGPGTPIILPNLMQRRLASLISERRRIGNWSGTGSGKTASAILAARVLGSGTDGGINLVVCPNSVVEQWADVIAAVYEDNEVATRTFHPVWEGDGPRWLVINYDLLREARGGEISAFLEEHLIDLFIVDEVHWVKRPVGSTSFSKEVSQRRRVIEQVNSRAIERNPDMAMLVMSATPVVNNLNEAVSLIELIQNQPLKDLGTRRTVGNVLAVNEHLVLSGIRSMPRFDVETDEIRPEVDATHLYGELLALRKTPGATTPLSIEQITMKAKLPAIVAQCVSEHRAGRKVMIYTEYVDGIIAMLTTALRDAGLSVGVHTGEEKEDLPYFLDRCDDATKVDVLIGSRAITTGVDGLQGVSSTLLFATLPWTHAAWQQTIGRLLRSGQKSQRLRVIVPMTFVVQPSGDLWQYDQHRQNRLNGKRELAQGATDGIISVLQKKDAREQQQEFAAKYIARLEEFGEITDVSTGLVERVVKDAA